MKPNEQSFEFKTHFLFIFLCLNFTVFAQKKYVLELHEGDIVNVQRFNDSLKVRKEIETTVNYYLNKGYLETRIDTLEQLGNTYKASLHIGDKYKWGRFAVSVDSDGSFFKKTFLNLEERAVDVQQFLEMRKKVVKEANNQGYPYATFFLSDIKSQNDSLTATINFLLGTRVFFDEILVVGDVVSKEFLQAYLNIKPKQYFSKEKINKIPYLVDKLKGVALAEAVNVQFYKNTCLIKLKLKNNPDDKIDALMGFQTNAEQKSEVIGNVNLSLNNLFQSSKKVQLNWQKPTQLNQQLNLLLDYPNVFLTSLGLQGGLDLFKRDTSYLNVGYHMRVYYRSYEQTISFNVQRQVSSLFREELKSDSLLSYKSVKSTLEYRLDKLKGNELKTQGYLFTSGLGVQQFLITDSNKVIPTTTLQFGFDGNVPLTSYLTYRQLVSGFAMLSEEVYVNQMKPIGGYNSIRGFNQNQFFTERYLVLSSAFVFHLGDRANLSTFSDYGFLLTSVGNQKLVSMGIGIDVKTNNTYLNFAYALGQSSSQKFSLALSKIHVGIATNF